MNINTKFSVGETVYTSNFGDLLLVEIKSIRVIVTKNEVLVEYCFDDVGWMEEEKELKPLE